MSKDGAPTGTACSSGASPTATAPSPLALSGPPLASRSPAFLPPSMCNRAPASSSTAVGFSTRQAPARSVAGKGRHRTGSRSWGNGGEASSSSGRTAPARRSSRTTSSSRGSRAGGYVQLESVLPHRRAATPTPHPSAPAREELDLELRL